MLEHDAKLLEGHHATSLGEPILPSTQDLCPENVFTTEGIHWALFGRTYSFQTGPTVMSPRGQGQPVGTEPQEWEGWRSPVYIGESMPAQTLYGTAG